MPINNTWEFAYHRRILRDSLQKKRNRIISVALFVGARFTKRAICLDISPQKGSYHPAPALHFSMILLILRAISAHLYSV